MASKQVLGIRVLNCGGMRDLMSELESAFLVNSLGLFRNAKDFGRGKPRANVNLARAYDAESFYRAAFCEDDVLHLVAHASATMLDVGVARKRVLSTEIGKQATASGKSLPSIVVSTGCNFQSTHWQKGLREAGAKVVIAANDEVTPANLTAFDMAFYSALLVQVYRGKTLHARVKAAFAHADKHYRAIHAKGTPFAKFTFVELTPPAQATTLPSVTEPGATLVPKAGKDGNT